MEFLKKIFGNVKVERIKFDNFNPNDKNFGEQLLQYFQKIISQNMDVNVKTGWVKKDDKFPIITITKAMDEIQKIEETKIVSIDLNIWANDKKSRDSITKNLSKILDSIDFSEDFQPELSEIRPLDFEEKYGVCRCQFDLTFHLKIKLPKKELGVIKDRKEKLKFLENIFPKFAVFDDFIELTDERLFLVHAKKETRKDILALVKDGKLIWKKEFENLVNFSLSSNGSFCIAVTQLKEKEMPSGYKSCSISPDSKYFGVTTMGPEWGVYYFDNKGKLLWKKKFDKRVGGIELTKNQIILYDKMHKETRKEVMRLDNKGKKTQKV